MKLFWFCVALLSLVIAAPVPASAAGARAWLDRDTMQLGETVTLNVEVQDAAAAAPDFSGLKQDFNLLGTQSSQQISVVNGKRSNKTLWAVGLEPTHAGRITIAPIVVGGGSTAPITLTVQAAAAKGPGKAGDDVFIEIAAEPRTPYVQQQVHYTVKLYYAFDLTDGNLNEPAADGIAVQRLAQGQDKSYLATLDGRRYHVVERHYAITPERSGSIDIPALAFRGNSLDVADPTGFFSRGRGVTARSEAVRLDVKAKPATWTDPNWLPASSVMLKDEHELPDEVHVGEPVTRTIRLQAQGLAFEQLPDVTLTPPAGADMYPDKPETRTRDDGDWLYGERIRKFAFVPNRAGSLVIPGTTVRWWDTANDRLAVAELPAHTIKVLAAVGAPDAPTPPAAQAGGTAPPAAVVAPATSPLPGIEPAAATRWKAVAVGAVLLWLGTLALWGWSRRRHAIAPVEAADTSADSGSRRAAFSRACAMGDLAVAERALVAWARNERPGVRNVGELALMLDDASQGDALAALQRVRYAGADPAGTAARLQAAFKGGFAWREAVGRRGDAGVPLPALYPDRG